MAENQICATLLVCKWLIDNSGGEGDSDSNSSLRVLAITNVTTVTPFA